MGHRIATVWSPVEVVSIPSQLRWTARDVVMKWFEADSLSLHALQEIEADAMSAMIDQTRWNGSGGRFCAILSVNGRQRLLFAAVQEDFPTDKAAVP